jgi:hypothetical protein
MAASPALAGWCNQIGVVTHCFDDKGNQTTITRVGNTYLTQERDKTGNTKTESFQLYDYNSNKADD